VISNLAFLPNVGVPELLIVLAIAILILGPKRIPEAARSVGRGIRGFRDTVGGEDGGKDGKAELDEGTQAEAREKSKSDARG
jgi:sec-independent protein translocase protein TatA